METSGDMHDENLCPFDIWAPDHRSSVNNKAFSAYAMRSQQLTDIVQQLSTINDDPNDFLVQQSIFRAVGIDSDTLTDQEVKYIEREVSRRRCLR